MTAPGVYAQQPADYFRQNCMSCHTIGGGALTGPDLKGAAERRDRAWLNRFMQNPQGMIDSGDPYAQQLVERSRGVVMPTPPGITPNLADALLDFIEAESQLPQSQFGGVSITDRPFTPLEVARGRELFLGLRSLESGGASCAACHTVGSMGGLGGGRLGPDLTRVYERLGNRKAVGTWLMAPATPTMQAVFREKALTQDEILVLLAYLEEARVAQPSDQTQIMTFFLLGLGGMVLGLLALQGAWRKRLQAVRRPLVESQKRGAM
ncbi:MAG: c-type cytochrome [Candidatus Acidiferrales bacterium]